MTQAGKEIPDLRRSQCALRLRWPRLYGSAMNAHCQNAHRGSPRPARSGEDRSQHFPRPESRKTACSACSAARCWVRRWSRPAARSRAGICHSFHAYFLRAGDPKIPILYEVDRSRDGASFTSRRVVAIQHGKQIFTMAASFQVEEKGLEHQFDMPKVPDPESLEDEHELAQEIHRADAGGSEGMDEPAAADRNAAGDRRQLDEPQAARAVRQCLDPRDGPGAGRRHRAAGAFWPMRRTCRCSTRRCCRTAARGIRTIQMASLDHAMWFHHPFRMDDWLLYAQD